MTTPTKRLSIELNLDDVRHLRPQAEAAGMSLAAYVRQLVRALPAAPPTKGDIVKAAAEKAGIPVVDVPMTPFNADDFKGLPKVSALTPKQRAVLRVALQRMGHDAAHHAVQLRRVQVGAAPMPLTLKDQNLDELIDGFEHDLQTTCEITKLLDENKL